MTQVARPASAATLRDAASAPAIAGAAGIRVTAGDAAPRWRTTGDTPATYSADDVAQIRAAGAVARAAVDAALRAAVPGATPASLASIVDGVIVAARAESAARGLRSADGCAYPSGCAIAVNERLVHAIPGDKPLRDGDVVTVDVAVRMRGWHADCAASAVVGTGTAEAHGLVDAARAMLRAALSTVAPGVRWSDVAAAMQDVADARGVGIVTDVGGHGIGVCLHEAPEAPCALVPGLRERADFTLRPGMVLAIEPTIALRPDAGGSTVSEDGCARPVALAAEPDGWTLRVASGLPGCYAEETVVVTASGCEGLTSHRFSELLEGSRR